MAKKMSGIYKMPLRITSEITQIDQVTDLLKTDKSQLNELLNRSPYQIICDEQNLVIIVDYLKDPVILDNLSRPLKITVKNIDKQRREIEIKLTGLSEGSAVKGLPYAPFQLAPNASKTFDLFIEFKKAMPTYRMMVLVSSDNKKIGIPFVLIKGKNEI